MKYGLVIAWMIVIFCFSKDPATVSNEKSDFVIESLTSVGIDVGGIFGKMSTFIVRKMGHFTEYFILCALLIFALKSKFKMKSNCMISIVITFLYACSDEFHQLFVPGRSGRIIDVLIDTTGGLLATFMFCMLDKFKNNHVYKLKK